MTSRFMLLGLVYVAFGAVTVAALMDVGYVRIFTGQFNDWGGAQVLIDLVILAALSCLWMLGDARKSGVNAWPFVFITVFAGSFGPLSYLIVREVRARSHRPSPV